MYTSRKLERNDRSNRGIKQRYLFYLSIIAYYLVGCAHFGTDIINFNINPGANIEVDQAIGLINYVSTRMSCGKRLQAWKIIFVNGWLQIKVDEETVIMADGYTDVFNQEIFITVHECFSDTALVHELFHVCNTPAFKTRLHEEDEQGWERVKEIEDVLVQRNCPEGYRREAPYF